MTDISKYERFECAPGLRLEAHERVSKIHHENMLMRITRVEEALERLERKLWLTVYGVVAVILAQTIRSFLDTAI